MERSQIDCDEIISSDGHFQSIIMNVDYDDSSNTEGYDVSQLVPIEQDGHRLGVVKATMSYKVLRDAIRSRLGSSFVLMNSRGETYFDDIDASPVQPRMKSNENDPILLANSIKWAFDGITT